MLSRHKASMCGLEVTVSHSRFPLRPCRGGFHYPFLSIPFDGLCACVWSSEAGVLDLTAGYSDHYN